MFVRRLAEWKLGSKSDVSSHAEIWMLVKRICDKLAHAAVLGLDDEGVTALVHLMRVISNVVLINEYGLFDGHAGIEFVDPDPDGQAARDAEAEALFVEWLGELNRVVDCLEDSITLLAKGVHVVHWISPKRRRSSTNPVATGSVSSRQRVLSISTC